MAEPPSDAIVPPLSLTVVPARSPSSVSDVGPSLVAVTVAHFSFAALVSTASAATSVSERVSVLAALGVVPGVQVSESVTAGVGPLAAPVWCSGFCSGSGRPPELGADAWRVCPALLSRALSALTQ